MSTTSSNLTSRSAGILLHITSLPSGLGIGDLGPAARAFVKCLSRARIKWWQMLPLSPPAVGNAPYQGYSAFAGNPLLISPEDLVRDHLLERGELEQRDWPVDRVQFERVGRFKMRLLGRAFERFRGRTRTKLCAEFEQFCHEQSRWLDDFCLFMAVHEQQGGRHWLEWPRELVFRRRGALETFREEHRDAVLRQQVFQFLFWRQLTALRDFARERGVSFFGDLPIFVAGDSADVWAHPNLFQLDRDRRPKFVSGVPPDCFSATGQLWGNPLYNWRAMKRDGYRWWIDRMRIALAQADLVRIDHFRGFAGYWSIPAGSETAEHGEWKKGPGTDLFDTMRKELGELPVVAEDLGLITPDVERLRDELGLPGMRVLQFGFGSGSDNPHLPHNHVSNSVVYTGTHDNDTTAGWYRGLKSRERQCLHGYAPDAAQDAVGALLRLAWSSVADLAIAPMQDILRLGRRARMNTPGRCENNWHWRATAEQVTPGMFDEIAEMTRVYGRG